MGFKVEEIKTKGGAKGLIIHVPGANTMAFEFEFRAGDRYAISEQKVETAHIMEHLAFGANAKYKTMRKNNAVLQKNGASTNAYTSHTLIMCKTISVEITNAPKTERSVCGLGKNTRNQ